MDNEDIAPFLGKNVKVELRTGNDQIAGEQIKGELRKINDDGLYVIEGQNFRVENIASVSRGI